MTQLARPVEFHRGCSTAPRSPLPTILLLLGGTVDPVVLVCRPDHLELVEKHLELPGVGHEGVNVRGAVTRPVLDQICDEEDVGAGLMSTQS